MADTHHGGEHHGPSFQQYMLIAGVLSVCTAASFAINQAISAKFIAFLLILTVAIIKATLVGMYFMHLKWDWKLLYFLIIPAFILGAMMAVVFLPDIFLNPSREMAEGYEIALKEQP